MIALHSVSVQFVLYAMNLMRVQKTIVRTVFSLPKGKQPPSFLHAVGTASENDSKEDR